MTELSTLAWPNDKGQSGSGATTPTEDQGPLWLKTRVVLAGLAPHARPHWRWLLTGTLAALVVVASRLALPWPFRLVTDQWTNKAANGPGLSPEWLPTALDLTLVMGLMFFGLIFALGLSDFLERLYFARFASATVRDLRTAAVSSAVADGNETNGSGNGGDLLSRFVGDAARVKSGIQGFLVRVATNGLVFFGVTIILFNMNAELGLIFGAAGITTALITGWAAAHIFRISLAHRAKEGRLAEQIQEALNAKSSEAGFSPVAGLSEDDETANTKFQGIATWTTHGIFGVAVLAALWVGASALESGQIQTGDMVVFMMYALMMRGPIVRLARQGARTGKILGAGYRLIQISMNTPRG